MVAKELSKNFYERENPRRSHRFVWLRYARVLLGISYDTYLKYLRIDTSSWMENRRVEESVSRLIESFRENFRTSSCPKPAITSDDFVVSQEQPNPDLIKRQAKIKKMGLISVRGNGMQTDKVYHFFTDGILYGIEDSLIARVVGKNSGSLSIGPVSTIFGFLHAEMPLPGKYTLFREATENEIAKFVQAESAHLNVILYPKQGGNKPS